MKLPASNIKRSFPLSLTRRGVEVAGGISYYYTGAILSGYSLLWSAGVVTSAPGRGGRRSGGPVKTPYTRFALTIYEINHPGTYHITFRRLSSQTIDPHVWYVET